MYLPSAIHGPPFLFKFPLEYIVPHFYSNGNLNNKKRDETVPRQSIGRPAAAAPFRLRRIRRRERIAEPFNFRRTLPGRGPFASISFGYVPVLGHFFGAPKLHPFSPFRRHMRIPAACGNGLKRSGLPFPLKSAFSVPARKRAGKIHELWMI